ncbi:NAD(P)/FAD-dependent oxidoreductase [Ciceribacter sp. L1K23]|uniref:NAD(P)/FAD-dependent oxidoreductase n=1 Tax=Ciceribacter sp. L1K23 TaxID=2820276 RepID=UPI001B8326F6|nr:NAD(P)/FAD-dependent oxidoreductase [Ciceribacter sp. L1K23]MBR0556921.1 NAD(P)/FAD-dependent oxidoreductase [Ciceribacter sp. L1K23]
MDEIRDVIIVGGSFAGLSAAMQLVRARRSVLLIDAVRPRNRLAQASHGFLGQDGVAPAEIRRRALEQLGRYPTFELLEETVSAVDKRECGFVVGLDSGRAVAAKRVILAVGVTDTLPEVEGLAALWGRSVFHCPYCHGYEIGGGPIGILASMSLAHHQAAMLPDWGEVTLFTEPGVTFSDDERWMMEGRGVAIEPSRLVRLLADGEHLKAGELADGRQVPLKALFVQPKVKPASPLAEMLGAAMEVGPQGPYVKVDDWGATSIRGLFAAGDAASPAHNATFASAAGVKAGVMAHRSLMMGD